MTLVLLCTSFCWPLSSAARWFSEVRALKVAWSVFLLWGKVLATSYFRLLLGCIPFFWWHLPWLWKADIALCNWSSNFQLQMELHDFGGPKLLLSLTRAHTCGSCEQWRGVLARIAWERQPGNAGVLACWRADQSCAFARCCNAWAKCVQAAWCQSYCNGLAMKVEGHRVVLLCIRYPVSVSRTSKCRPASRSSQPILIDSVSYISYIYSVSYISSFGKSPWSIRYGLDFQF